jgi:hypothetical protein
VYLTRNTILYLPVRSRTSQDYLLSLRLLVIIIPLMPNVVKYFFMF